MQLKWKPSVGIYIASNILKSMAKEKFVLVSLQEDKAKQLAQVISNPSCTKILDFLSDQQATESEISKNLNIPLSTVHYNIQQLMNSGLVIVDEFHYSSKGKEVNHYKLANKYIIMAPRSVSGLNERLKALLMIGVMSAGIALAIRLYNSIGATPMASKVADSAALMVEAAPAAQIASQVNPALWFIYGATFVLIMIVIVEYLRYKRGGKP